MSNIEDLVFDGTEVILNGEKHRLLFGMQGMRLLIKKYGTFVKALKHFQSMNIEIDDNALDDLQLLLYTGMLHENKDLKLDDVGKCLHYGNLFYVFSTAMRAVSGSMPQNDGKNAKAQTE